MFTKYHTSDLLKYFGITRDTLRFYEEKGLLTPQKNSQNNYRDYDIYKLIIIEFLLDASDYFKANKRVICVFERRNLM